MTTKDKLSPIEHLKVDELGDPKADTITTKETDDDYVGARIIAEINDLKQMTLLKKKVVYFMLYIFVGYLVFAAILTTLDVIQSINVAIDKYKFYVLWGLTIPQFAGIIIVILKLLFNPNAKV